MPQRKAKRGVIFAHGLADTALGWVCGGITASHAFAAYDEGMDVFLADFRGAPPREHLGTDMRSTEYWHFTLDELGFEDLAAFVHHVQETKHRERSGDGEHSLKLVAHSTGCIAAMEYVVGCKKRGVDHGLNRVVLLCPAGFHMHKLPYLFFPVIAMDVLFRRQMLAWTPGVFIPTRLLRLLMNKLTQDFQNAPAVAELVKVVIGSGLFGGDASDWTQALAMPHYNVQGMPGVSLLMMLHFRQLWLRRTFTTFDWSQRGVHRFIRNGPRFATPYTRIAPGKDEVWDIGASYSAIDVPIDLVAGTLDYVVAPDNVREHERRLLDSHVSVSLRWFNIAHLDAIHRPHNELRDHVLACLSSDPFSSSPRRRSSRPL